MPCSSIAVRLISATVTSSITCWLVESPTMMVWVTGCARARLPDRERGLGDVRLGGERPVRDGGHAERRPSPPGPGMRQRLGIDHDRARSEHDDAGDLRVADRHALHRPAELEDAALPGLDPERLAGRGHRVGGLPARPRLGAGRAICRCTPSSTARPALHSASRFSAPVLRQRRRRRGGAGPEQRAPEHTTCPQQPTDHHHPRSPHLPPRWRSGTTRAQNELLSRDLSPSSTSTECRGRRSPAPPLAPAATRAARRGFVRTSNSVSADMPRRAHELGVAVVAQGQPHRLVARGKRQLLRLVGRHQQRDGRHLDRLVVALLDALADRQHPDVLEHELAALLLVALGPARGSPPPGRRPGCWA